jgi:phage antirepressor YoqD-like protein
MSKNPPALSIGASAVTMTSLEIAELVNSNHADVRRSIERLAERGVITLPPLAEVSNPGPGPRSIAVYPVTKRDSYVIVAQLSPEFTARLVDRWQELEASVAVQVPQTMAQALRLAAEQAEALEVAHEQLALAAPKVDFHDRYAVSTGNKGVREVAKLLEANERQFIAWLTREDGPMYRLAGSLTPKAPQLDAGRFAVKAGTAEHGDNSHAYNQAKFTPKGVTWVAGEWAKHQLAQRGEA